MDLVASKLYSSIIIKSNRHVKTILLANNDDKFDPLLSPHAYPKGTSAGPVKKTSNQETNDNTSSVSSKERHAKDDYEDWSPLKMKSVKKDFQGASQKDYAVEKSIFTTQWSAVSVTSSAHVDSTESSSSTSSSTQANSPVKNRKSLEQSSSSSSDFEFDPLLSPHAYPKGTKSGPIARPITDKSTKYPKEQQTIGVLIMDHGSKRPSSNERLYKIRDMYQSVCPKNYVVKAAHMEIAQPSIQSQIEAFCSEGIYKIVCHPYFLSPGRHVLEDIPQIIEEAKASVKKQMGDGLVDDFEVILTDPVGSKLDLMVGLIGNIIEEALDDGDDETDDDYFYESGFMEKSRTDSFMLGGFFGEIKRMMEEEEQDK